MADKYPLGTVLKTTIGITGKVIENFKLPPDICIEWETGEVISYDEDFIDEHFLKINEKNHEG